MQALRSSLSYLLIMAAAVTAQAQIPNFQHILLVIQENRTPDNLFQGLCLPPYGSASACGTGAGQFDIQSYGLDKNGNHVPLSPVPLGNGYDPEHTHGAFEKMCNPNTVAYYPCAPNTRLSTTGCPANCSFEYVDPNSTPSIDPYLYLAQTYGWANRMFQTNQGPSTAAHQFLFAGTSALTAADDAAATFVAENNFGCTSTLNSLYYIVSTMQVPTEQKMLNNPLGSICANHDTMATLLDNNHLSWRYYAYGDVATGISNSTWNAPLSIQAICVPNSTYTQCTGSEWTNDVDLRPADILTHLQNCQLANVAWLTPTGLDSDHPSGNNNNPANGGPAWVSSVVNALTASTCADTVNGVSVPYWQDTAVVLLWDDWGGFYDHVLPTFLTEPALGIGDFEMGFRVPLIFISAYTPHMIDSQNQYDFGSILRFIEHNFGIAEGALGFADHRSTTDLTAFYNLKLIPTLFSVPGGRSADFYLNDTRHQVPPDRE